jgi:AAA15 family ATPase/GTPase
MKPISIEIENYRSIKKVALAIENLADGTRTFGLIGVNEAGKSSILRAIALIQVNAVPVFKDFRDEKLPISISIMYELDEKSRAQLIENVDVQDPERDTLIKEVQLAKTIQISTAFDNPSMSRKQTYFAIAQDGMKTDLTLSIIGSTYMSQSIFWTAEKKYLITEPVNLDEFAASPDNVSIPLRNCFFLAGYNDIQKAITDLRGSTEKEHLQDTLGEEVTKHILAVWPGHPIKITFSIDNRVLYFHVKDDGSKAKAKTADQRSDGFKQFISFLLTVSAENKSERLTNAILLIDEPETHLHPKAQEYLLDELKKITEAARNNVVFFATHSTFMIDKKDLSRHYRVKKQADQTAIEKLGKTATSFSEVNFKVFDIYSTDYHGELYSKLHATYQAVDDADHKRAQIKSFDEEFFHKEKKLSKNKPWRTVKNDATLPTYIRNCIHHSDNGHTFTDEQLVESTDLMLKMLN